MPARTKAMAKVDAKADAKVGKPEPAAPATKKAAAAAPKEPKDKAKEKKGLFGRLKFSAKKAANKPAAGKAAKKAGAAKGKGKAPAGAASADLSKLPAVTSNLTHINRERASIAPRKRRPPTRRPRKPVET